jgi:type I restriction enzyme S subunit
MSVPKLRFGEFTGRWKFIHLGEIAQTVTSGSRDWAQHYAKSGSKFIRMTNLSREGIQLKLDDLKFVDVKSESSDGQRTSLTSGDILISITAELGKIGWVPPNFGEAYINQHTALVRINNAEADSRFVAHLLSTPKQNKQLNRMNDSGAKAGLNLPTIKSVTLYIPELEEQTKISSFLTAVDEKISQLTKKRDLLTQYKKGVMQKIFSQELRFKDDDGRDFPDWRSVTLGEIAKFSKGKGISKADVTVDGHTPCIRYGELYTLYGETIREIESKTDIDPADLVLSEVNDVIIPASGETQIDIATASCVMEAGVALGGDLNIIKSSENGIFLAYYLNSQMKLDIAKLAQGNSVVHLYSSQLKQLELLIPEVEEQSKIANFLSAIDEKITATQSQLDAVKQYKQGLLQQMFV